MAAPTVTDTVPKGAGAYWRDLVFSRLVPALFFSIFLARQLLFTWDGLHSVHQPGDSLFVGQQLLALAYFTMLVILYSTRLPKRGTDHRAAVVFIAFTGTFSAIAAPFLPGGAPPGHRGPLLAQPASGVPRRDRDRDRDQPRHGGLAGGPGDRLFHRVR